MTCRYRFPHLALCFSCCLPLSAAALHAQAWITPTPEELSMTSIPEVPGAPAVYLDKVQTTDDGLHMFSFYVRLKVLTDRGKEYANVELPYVGGEGGTSVDEIAGRTIHPDGSIVPFSGKPYDKLVIKGNGYKYKEKVFTLPAVDVGSIIEYRYKFRMNDNWYRSPDWMIQSELYTRKAHYMWRPTAAFATNGDGRNSITWTPILPVGAKVIEIPLQTSINSSSDAPNSQLDLDVHDIPPLPQEEYMPPLNSLSYRVLFYYTRVRTAQEYWNVEGKNWSKARDKFIGPRDGVKNFVSTVISPTDTQDQKARKLYAALMKLENTDFTRERTTREEKADGLKQISTSDDILARKRGNGDQLTELFIAMCRAAGLKAYVMGVADRSQRIFLPQYLSFSQLDDYLAIVSIDGKEVFFDPGQRFCEPEHLAWRHTIVGGLRQTEGGTTITGTPGEVYKTAHTSRIADMTLDEQGVANGTVTLSYTGAPALHRRQEALKGDDTSLNEGLRTDLEGMLPGGLEIRVTQVDNLADYDKPLVVKYSVKGPIGSSTGKRLLMQANLFETNEKPRFPEPKRELAIDMHYPSYSQDAVRIAYPQNFTVESAPAPDKDIFANAALFEIFNRTGPNSITTYRNVMVGKTIFLSDSYADLRSFYAKLETKDQETLVLTHATPAATAAATTKPAGN